MLKSEILNLRNLFAILGWEHTPDQVKNDFCKELEIVKSKFLQIKPLIPDLLIGFDEKEITLEDFSKELENRIGTKVSIDHAKQLLIMNSIFEDACE